VVYYFRVIRPFASDSPTSSAKPSPQSTSSASKHHPSSESQLYGSSPPLKTRAPSSAASSRQLETSSRISPVMFTSSSSSSSSGSPYRGRSPTHTPPPPSLAPNLLPSGILPSSSGSPMDFSPSSSRSPSPPTLYPSPDIDEKPPEFLENPVARRKSSPPLPSFPSYPPSRFSQPVMPGNQSRAAATSANVTPPQLPPPPSKAAGRSAKLKQSVVTETVSKIVVSCHISYSCRYFVNLCT